MIHNPIKDVGALDWETTVHRRPRKPVIVSFAAMVVLMALVGLLGLMIANRNGLAAAESDKNRRENEPPDYQRATQVSVEFGATNRESGLSVVEVGDSRHTLATVDGQQVWFFHGGWNYAYFSIDPDFKRNLGADVVVRAEYQIPGRNPIGVHYDGLRGPYSPTVDIQRDYKEPNSNWRVIEFRARDARFQNSQNGRADLRVYDNEKGFYLRRVTLTRYPGRRMPPRDSSTSSNLVDLTAFYNASLRSYMPGGDVDSVSNVIREIRTTTGVHFDARGYIGLLRRGEESGRSNSSPESVTGIPIGRRVTRLHFLHSASYGEKEDRKSARTSCTCRMGPLRIFRSSMGEMSAPSGATTGMCRKRKWLGRAKESEPELEGG